MRTLFIIIKLNEYCRISGLAIDHADKKEKEKVRMGGQEKEKLAKERGGTKVRERTNKK